MYKVASDKKQSSLYRGTPADWINGEERLSGEDRVNQLRQNIHTLEDRLKSATGAERKRLGQEKLAVQAQLKAINDAKPPSPVDWKQHFVNEAKRLLSDSQFQMILNAAKHEAARVEAKRNPRKADMEE